MTPDQILAQALPTLAVPRRDACPEIEIGATRMLLGRNGLFIEARTEVMHAIGRIAAFHHPKLHYGHVEPGIWYDDPLYEVQAEQLVAETIAIARRHLPSEWACNIVAGARGLELQQPAIESATPASVRYRTAGLDPLRLAVDLHTHGRLRAFFSGQDDIDDRSNPSPCFIAVVVGSLDKEAPSFAQRLVINGYFFEIHEGEVRDARPS